ncbi:MULTISPECIES: fatty-acid--CoA ligase FadD5 [Rhodococcus]|uniref:Fatty-acid--CoA ligase FadD5 n=1 Tax=Rhodococcus cerastii TaxID=908616 RepID=A0ABU4D2N2_9NOCA|nr:MULTISPECIES: fatty-acid--CoA ligase FadD5 [Rhodococcus]MDV6303641.1 fatty-acid--CoA ligase FadD5 [Rhodococcus cerastii]MDV7991677.1 fatty-acid--CoA ligase FadD5 [Rhodococcus sp. IEGM 1374]OZE39966.1 long-chain fatty acid--CoA ligase [Rhodococcus sp. 05-2254-4]OZE49534.1 long-chain fatty acid--CoA ligase [Rhodococcus sp. 05-2254-3]OZE50172.1 long-chain fatty acid--CoA ligase [Rhodococcus sp. 05-2254-2]
MAAHPNEPRLSNRNNWNNHVRRHALMQPDAVALRFQGRSISWRELDDRVSRCAGVLQSRGIGFGDRVLIVMLNRPEYLEAVLAINALGALAVPVNFRMTPPEVAFLAQNSGSTLVITDDTLTPLAEAVVAQSDSLNGIITVGDDYEALLSAAEPADTVDVPDDAPALIMYTSGTTGRPKGAVLTHANMQAQAFTCIRALQMSATDEVGFCASPMFHIAALGSLAPSLLLGIPTVVHPVGAFDPGTLLDVLAAEGVTNLFLVPVQWQAMCAEQAANPRELALRVISWGAAPASDTVLRAMSTTFPGALNVAVFGQTEMSPITCVLDGVDAVRKLGSVGRVIPTIAARVVDDEMNDVAQGEIGEIVYRGPTLMQGYWENPDATADAFHGGWFHSGDLVRQDEEGFVFVVDRKKDMIISGGENIYCAEVENVLFSHPRILEAAVIGRPDDRWGEVPVAVVALHDSPGTPDLTLDELLVWLGDHLARFKHPKDLVVVDALPRNASGKVVKVALRKTYSPAPA